ncbi:hypothetical protein Poli38472_012601 [Pythium oligandrum]|uniref:FYVE-type domain-containing protein n=1 Tax=Pythium oligandrum TaxID=41045 RepID=A0A8K1FF97_PYTOL|nr:hypothetical protein Poli38472_012601 [Pythium oligandrum]|eukprot:TMW61410.1 hypothetical protein Poli38472_012601 [Pythium oligandrum]
MKPRSTAVPTLSLSSSEKRRVVDDVTELLRETLWIEKEFLANSGVVDEKQWKKVKSRDNVCVYRERQTHSSNARPSVLPWKTKSVKTTDDLLDVHESRNVSKTRSLSADGDDVLTSIKNPEVPMLVATGYFDGSLEDSVYGSVAGDELSWRLRAAYMKDKFADAKIVASINEPTVEQPYNYLSIKWFVSEFPALLTAFIQRRDFLVAEATGLEVDAQGERYGYYIVHDFHHPKLQDLSDFGLHRSKISLCFITREIKPGTVHVFARGFVDPRGALSNNVAAVLAAGAMLSAAHTVDASFAKKLAWLMSREHQDKRPQEGMPASAPDVCVSCDKTSGFLKARLSPCHLCRHTFCSRCTSQRKVVIDVTKSEVTERAFPFCLTCITRVKQQSPRDVALDAITQNASRKAPASVRAKSASVAIPVEQRVR